MVEIKHYVADDINIVFIQFREEMEPDYGTEVAPGVILHYKGSRDEGEIIPVFIEIMGSRSLPLDRVEFERVNENGERLDEPDAAEILKLWLTLAPEARRSIGAKMREAGKAATK